MTTTYQTLLDEAISLGLEPVKELNGDYSLSGSGDVNAISYRVVKTNGRQGWVFGRFITKIAAQKIANLSTRYIMDKNGDQVIAEEDTVSFSHADLKHFIEIRKQEIEDAEKYEDAIRDRQF